MNSVVGITRLGLGLLVANTPSPTTVGAVNTSSTRSGTAALGASGTMTLSLPVEQCLAGNTIVVGVKYTTSMTPTCSDSHGTSYTLQANNHNATLARSIAIFVLTNITTANGQAITVTFPSDPGNHVQMVACCFSNIASVSGSPSIQEGTGTAIDGLLQASGASRVFQFVICNSNKVGAVSSTNELLSVDTQDGIIAQMGPNAKLTLPSSDSWLSASIVLAGGSGGAVPAGPYVKYIYHGNFPVSTSAGGTGSAFATSATLQCPNLGCNVVCAMSGGGTGGNITSITDTAGNTYTEKGPFDSTFESVSAVYAAEDNNGSQPIAKSGTNTLSVTWRSGAADATVLVYGLVGCFNFDVVNNATGTQSSVGTLTAGSITPTGSSGIVLTQMPVEFDTVVPSGGTWKNDQHIDSAITAANPSGPEPVDENNGWAHMTYLTNPGATSSQWVGLFAVAGGFQNWDWMAIAFK